MLIKICNAYVDPTEIAAVELYNRDTAWSGCSPAACIYLKHGGPLTLDEVTPEKLRAFLRKARLMEAKDVSKSDTI